MDPFAKEARTLLGEALSPDVPYGHVQALIRGLETEDRSKSALAYYRQGRRASHLSYGEFVSKIGAMQALLSVNYGVAPGQRVAILSYNSPAFVVGALSLMGLSAIVVPLNPADSQHNLRYILAQSGTSLVLHSTELGDLARSIADDLAVADIDVAFDTEPLQVRHVISQNKNHDEPVPAVLLYTSGTTGKPKGVLLSHDALLLNAWGLKSNFHLGRETAHLCVLPLFHANAWGFSMLATYLSHARLVLCDKFPLLSFWNIVDEEQVTVTSLTPVLLKPLGKLGGAAGQRSLHVVSAAAPLPVDVARQFYEHTGLRICQGYGLSECTNFATIMSPDLDTADYLHLMHDHSQTCIGTALPGTEVLVVDSHGTPLGPGEKGELAVRGANNMLGYWRDPERTKEALTGGLLHTGDQGWYLVFNSKNYYYISGRYKDLIIRLGENISPTNIESQLGPVGAIGDYAVVGFSNVYVDEEVGLWVDPAALPAESPDQVSDTIVAAIEKLPFFQQPKVVLIGSMNEARTSVGKIRRTLLAGHFAEFRDRGFRPTDKPIVQWVSA